MPVIAQHYGPKRDENASERNETELERWDRNLVELLQEVRVAQTGVQVLFGFLLAIVFTPRFRSISTFQRVDYFATLPATAAAAVLLIAPTAYHRILFRRGDKQYLVKAANRYTLFGLTVMAVAMIGVVLLISDLMFSSTVTIVTTTIVTASCATTWFLMPLARRRALSQRRHSPSAAAGSAPPRPGSRAPTRP